MKVRGRKMKAKTEMQKRPLVEILGAQVGELLVEQGGALAHRLQLLGHSREAVGGLADVEPVVLGEPAEIESGEGQQGVAIGRDEAAEGDRLGPDPRDRRAQFVDRCAAADRFRNRRARRRARRPAGSSCLLIVRAKAATRSPGSWISPPSSASATAAVAASVSAGHRVDLAAPHPHPDRDQPVGIVGLARRPGRAD